MKWIVVYEDLTAEYSGTLGVEEFDNELKAIEFWDWCLARPEEYKPKYLACVGRAGKR